MENKQQINRVSGGLLAVLKHARVAWYQGSDATTAYYEQPAPGVPGLVVVNGERVCTLAVDQEGLYADFPSPGIQRKLTERGVKLEQGWTCPVQREGMDINEAVCRSRYRAAKHHNGQISVQCMTEREATILVDGVPRWTLPIPATARVFAEMEVWTEHGWYPVPYDVLEQYRQDRAS